MILNRNALLELNYEVSTDILYVRWPNLSETDIPELKRAMAEMVDALKHYDVKRFLIDSSQSQVDIADEEYKPLIFSLINQLKDTRLKRMARVMPGSTYRATKLRSYTEEMQAKNMFNFETSEFESKDKALNWLKQ